MRHTIPAAAELDCRFGEPRACYASWRQSRRAREALLLVDFEFIAYWLEDPAPLLLTAIYFTSGEGLRLAVTDQALVAESLPPREQFLRWTARHQLLCFEPGNPLELAPEPIGKPWGREIWYSAVERRGVCSFARGDARSPIPWLQAVAPSDAAGAPGQPLVLLKILDPLPQPLLGDLYFELHESKREVYVVTHIDPGVWPDGRGYIRYGFDPAVVSSYASEDQFRADYLRAVEAYEVQRRVLDALQERGDEPDPAQLGREQALRERMHHFTHLRPLQVGDAVEIPLLLPHALQHGIRAVEIQTPSYERKILSFGQKVLTQPHWDTREAVARMKLVPTGLSSPVTRFTADGVAVEQIVDNPDFHVLRAVLQPGASWEFRCGAGYALVMVVSGALDLEGRRYAPEQALILPHSWRGWMAAAETAPPLVFLLAKPCG